MTDKQNFEITATFTYGHELLTGKQTKYEFVKQGFEKDINVPSKQIIIDGCDVSGCEHYDEVCLGNHHYKWCKDNDNCYYKQLKRKKQECEELKKENHELAEEVNIDRALFAEIDRLKAELEKYKNESGLEKCYLQQLDQVKAENEELTTINARLLGRLEVNETDTSLVFNLDRELRQKEKEFYTAIKKVAKLKQTLIEIKEIAENAYCLTNGINKDMANFAKQILQKISEVE